MAIEAAKINDCTVIGFSGKNGGQMKNECDLIIKVPSNNTARIQEMHIMIFLIICNVIDKNFE